MFYIELSLANMTIIWTNKKVILIARWLYSV